MKTLIITLLLAYFGSQQKLDGNYKLEFEEKYNLNDGIVSIQGDAYERNIKNGKILKGDIIHKNKQVILTDKKSNLKIELFTDEIQNDTIHFRTSKTDNLPIQGDIIIYSGKMIKIKS